MILVDSSVGIDFLRGKPTPQTDKLDDLLDSRLLGIGDLTLVEVLQRHLGLRCVATVS